MRLGLRWPARPRWANGGPRRPLLTRIDDWDAVTRVHGEVFGSIRPANTVMQVVRFIDPEWLVEIEVDAVAGPGAGRIAVRRMDCGAERRRTTRGLGLGVVAQLLACARSEIWREDRVHPRTHPGRGRSLAIHRPGEQGSADDGLDR